MAFPSEARAARSKCCGIGGSPKQCDRPTPSHELSPNTNEDPLQREVAQYFRKTITDGYLAAMVLTVVVNSSSSVVSVSSFVVAVPIVASRDSTSSKSSASFSPSLVF
jgi:hypothetical protein